MRPINEKDLHKRLLVTTELGMSLTEVEVLEFSPSGARVKLRNAIATTIFWEDTKSREVVEELKTEE